jgi:Icc-related predicted phosphoesterase
MSKIMLLGDTHGNTKFIFQAIREAKSQGVHWIYQVGDFGYWEHSPWGVAYLNHVSEALMDAKIELVFIQGNHDKVSLISEKYSAMQGFYSIRPGLWYAPNGTFWGFHGTSFLALGGAYSIDKDIRLEDEDVKAHQEAKVILAKTGYPWSRCLAEAREKTTGTYWFPEEEMSDDDLDRILAEVKNERVDVILAHDKPFASNPMIKLLTISETIPNQRRLQKAVTTLQPKMFVHGHLHVRYRDTIRCGDDNAYTLVEGLGADVPNFTQSQTDWRANDAWEFLNLGE